MEPSSVLLEKKEAVKALSRRFPVSNIRLFGSVLHDRYRSSSDVDLLVDAYRGQPYSI